MNTIEQQTTINKGIVISNYYSKTGTEETIREIITGLISERKYIPSKYFYDHTGSKLFEDITHLPEYYPSRTEKSILQKIAPQIASGLKNTDLVELGSGDCSKISIILKAVPGKYKETVRYVPVDISHAAILKSADNLRKQFPDIRIHGITADFMSHLERIPGKSTGKRLICFFGSTLGNLSREQAGQFLLNLGNNMQPGDQLLLGLDMVKEKTIVEKAYNDSERVTAAFNRNILNVVNNFVHTDFDPDCFEHVAFYNEKKSGIEMHLKALTDIRVRSPHLPGTISLKRGETIHTENSHKFTFDHITNFAMLTGFKIRDIFCDANRWFSLVHFEC
jgi:L-histidine N-alpha-methyltransferase